MNHTPQLKKAIQFAARKHHGQMRLEAEPLPYITHLFLVALLAAEGGASDDVVVAALLHDTIEDTSTTKEEIAEAFNEKVADLVEAVTERKEIGGQTLDWKARKEEYLGRLEHSSDEALVIALGDKIDNVESKLEAYAREGTTLLKRWKQPTSEYLWYHGAVLQIAQKRLPEYPLTKRLAEACAEEKNAFT